MFDAITATQFAMEFDQLKLQSISQNVANMNTPGFKRQLVESAGFDEQLEPQINNSIQQVQRAQINIQGTLTQTHNLNDLALTGDSYFQVQSDQGIFYTRRGDFQINKQGELCTATGETVLGKGGTIKVEDSSFTVDTQGALYIDHHKVDQLNIVRFEQPQLLDYVGNGLYQTNESPNPSDGTTRVLQGFIEQSNVKSIDEMMDMIKTSRHFEASQRVMRTADNLLSTAINQLGEGNV
ncbi:flagellar hook-basal body protein [Legionella bononiensis]|uniref:Flagellar hook-basal body protein n=1 Tax=Legionella bononiensis TaxID=2793102 RepID=A0ABS1WD61_9GAMM|nr:flagellar hook-basal body protein [Legionella bononiensis]MBL7479161.1 flagellar hook-basal body protein [Legionella bononiensis]MBL7527294.1 flagellar hook-basal body protein [Legionella bononiensis]MBL7562263.1 flagellar hook-basal body protein [Legionella bononiensis]